MVSVPVVIAANFVIGFLCLIAAFGLWKATQLLKRLTKLAVVAERNIHNILHDAPAKNLKGKSAIANLRLKYQALEPKLQQVQQMMSLLSMTRFLWGRRFMVVPPPARRR